MLDKIKKLRIEAMKQREAGKDARLAYEGVISLIDRNTNPSDTITDSLVIQTIKKEIKAYSEMTYDPSAAAKSAILEELLPRQLTTEELKQEAEIYLGNATPKDWMKYLDSEFADQYDKRTAIQVFNEIIKTSGGRK